MGVGSRFDQPLTLISDGRQVIACGPLGFFACETHAEVIVSMHQTGHGQAHGNGAFVNPDYDPSKGETPVGDDEDEWMLTADVTPQAVGSHIRSATWSSFAFAPTAAYGGGAPPVQAHGVIRYHRDGSRIDTSTWTGDGMGNDLEVRWQ